MNVMDAAHATVRNYPGGSESLGPRVGITPAVLRNKVNPNSTTHRLAIDEASAIMGVTGDFSMLYALAAEHGFVLQASSADDGGGNLLGLVLATHAREGDFARVVADALDDGLITAREERAIAAAGYLVQDTVQLLLARLRELVGVRAAGGGNAAG